VIRLGDSAAVASVPFGKVVLSIEFWIHVLPYFRRGAAMRHLIIGLIAFGLLSAESHAAKMRTWTDRSGNSRVEAELVRADDSHVTLRKADGTQIRVPIVRLSDADRGFVAKVAGGKVGDVEPANSATYAELESLIGEQRKATVVLSLIDGFLAADGIAESQKALAQINLPMWKQRAAKDAIRAGSTWITPDEFRQMKSEEMRLIKEAHRLIDIKSDELAKEKFLEASNVQPQEVRANFYLGLLNALVAHYPPDAQRHFSDCVKRLTRDNDLLVGTRKANLIAALNNVAIVQVRRAQYNQAIRSWRRALRLEPFTPELVQNLGRMVQLAQLGELRIGKNTRDTAAELYAEVCVQFSLARFDESVGWLFIPYVDTVDGSMEATGDEELVPVAWCTGFAVGGNLLLTSRYPFVDADAVSVRGGGPPFAELSGKVVSLSDESNLALIRIDGLGANPRPLNSTSPKTAQDVTIVGYGQPGLAGGRLQHRKATILNPPRLYQQFAGIVTKTTDENTSVAAPVYNYYAFRNKIVHDAITNAGLEGAPLIDAHGTVVGVHIGNRPEFGEFGSKHSWAEPIEWVLPFLEETSRDFDVRHLASDGTKTPEAIDAEAIGNGFIYQLVAQRRAPRLKWSHRIEELHRLQEQDSWTSYEDNTCMVCNGRKQIACPNRLCARGRVPKKERIVITHNAATGEAIYGTKTKRVQCITCGGDGFVDCPLCH
jgi:S1-C subfamily serine protease